VSTEDALIELEILPVEIPDEPEAPSPATPPYYLTAPRPRASASPGLTVRDVRAAGVGALVVGVLALVAWLAQPAPRLN
jgi:hypothetical protein